MNFPKPSESESLDALNGVPTTMDIYDSLDSLFSPQKIPAEPVPAPRPSLFRTLLEKIAGKRERKAERGKRRAESGERRAKSGERKGESAIGFDGEMRNGESNFVEAERGERRAESGERKIESAIGSDGEMRNGESNLARTESGERKGEGAIGSGEDMRNGESGKLKVESAIGSDKEIRNRESNFVEAEKGKLEEEIAQLKAEIAVLKAESGKRRAESGKLKVESAIGSGEDMRNGESNLARAESGERKGESAIGSDGEMRNGESNLAEAESGERKIESAIGSDGEMRNGETDIAKAGGDEGEVSSDMESEGTEGARISLEKDGEFGRRKRAHVLKAEGLKKVFGKKTAVFDVSFEVHTGEIVGLLGPNGAGKTTSFYMVVGFHKPTLGRIRLDDDDITELPMYKRAQLGIAYLPQEASVFKKLTVEENIWAILEMRKELSDEETIAAIPKAWKKLSEKGRRKILEATGDDKIAREDGSWSPDAEETDAILQKCGELSRGDKSKLLRAGKREILENLIAEFTIGHIRKQFAYTLSGGERRRTEIARALANNPKFILLDEPFAGIDPIAVSDIKGIIRHLAKRGIGVLITDHNVRDTLEITERAYIVSREDEMGGNIGGHILVSGDKKTIIENPEARHIYLGDNFKM
ncbi:hypothetical protein TRSA_05460 [Treponema saccharophilum]|uniref:ABC transporter related protein n=2 Tax=Treponema saccharophilum TaxID=165 RepID=H7EHL3_9SPIR|nr:ABC transporter related protein [Treponema saccharophilum DSM 2985]BDC95447.1 hypothetical protein TRSA_05460 [Treponema saccharophilum]